MYPSKWNNFDEVVNYLYSIGNEVLKLKYDLSVANELIHGIFPSKFHPSILIAGTNGKGSVAWWLASVLEEAGYNTALYTSPHLTDIRERIRLNRRKIKEEEFLLSANEALTHVKRKSILLNRKPTFYEWITLIAASFFNSVNADIHVLEVGLGGRFDAVNVANPILSVITTVSLDHQEFLGNTISQIAKEKLGIARRNAPLVIGPQSKWLNYVEGNLSKICKKIVLSNTKIMSKVEEYKLGLEGRFQRYNAATVLSACLCLKEMGWDIDNESIRRGLATGGWEGRMEKISSSPCIIVDGAHNPQAIEMVLEEIKAIDKHAAIIFGAMKDKDIKTMLSKISTFGQEVVFTKVSSPRSATRIHYEKYWKKGQELKYFPDPVKALKKVVSNVGKDGFVFVLGSLYLVAEIKKYFAERLEN